MIANGVTQHHPRKTHTPPHSAERGPLPLNLHNRAPLELRFLYSNYKPIVCSFAENQS